MRLFYALLARPHPGHFPGQLGNKPPRRRQNHAHRDPALTLAFLGNIDMETAEELIDATPCRLEPGSLTHSTSTASSTASASSGPAPPVLPTTCKPSTTACGSGCPATACSAHATVPPHVTLLRDIDPAKAPEPTPEPLIWHYDRMVMVASNRGRTAAATASSPNPARNPTRRLSALAQSAGRNDPDPHDHPARPRRRARRLRTRLHHAPGALAIPTSRRWLRRPQVLLHPADYAPELRAKAEAIYRARLHPQPAARARRAGRRQGTAGAGHGRAHLHLAAVAIPRTAWPRNIYGWKSTWAATPPTGWC